VRPRGEGRSRGLGIKRAKRDRWILGVCGGIAHTYGWSPALVRLLAVVLAVFIPGFSLIPALIVYVVLGMVLPESEEF